MIATGLFMPLPLHTHLAPSHTCCYPYPFMTLPPDILPAPYTDFPYPALTPPTWFPSLWFLLLPVPTPLPLIMCMCARLYAPTLTLCLVVPCLVPHTPFWFLVASSFVALTGSFYITLVCCCSSHYSCFPFYYLCQY